MRCNRCGYAVPEWLWLGDDHPIIIEERPAHIYRDDDISSNTIKITAESMVGIRMCSEVNIPKNSDFIDIGPECFADKDEFVISWKGENFYKACGQVVKGRLDGATTSCVKRKNHKNECEDYDGDTRVSVVLEKETKSPQEIAYELPEAVVYFAAIRLGAYATTGKYGNTVVPELGLMDAIKRYADDHKIEE